MPKKSTIHYCGRTYQPPFLVAFSIDGKPYTYELHPQHAETVEYLAHKVSLGKALAFAKRRAMESTYALSTNSPSP